MQTLLCATSNATKFGIGQALLKKYGIKLEQIVLDIDEIQAENPEVIIRDKVKKAFELTNKPVVVSDDSWNIPALNGFPGAYAKSINSWFTPEDFIRLTKDLKDRRIYLQQLLAYHDGTETVVFRSDIPGELVKVPAGIYGVPIMKVVSLECDNGHTISQTYDSGGQHDDNRLLRRSDAWQELAKWYKQKLGVN